MLLYYVIFGVKQSVLIDNGVKLFKILGLQWEDHARLN